jgi:hypothetical protein
MFQSVPVPRFKFRKRLDPRLMAKLESYGVYHNLHEHGGKIIVINQFPTKMNKAITSRLFLSSLWRLPFLMYIPRKEKLVYLLLCGEL